MIPRRTDPKKLWAKTLSATGFVALLFLPLASGSIISSPHDFSRKSWNPSGEICIVCHTPHNAASSIAPLWNHEVTSANHTVYSSATLTASVGAPSALSRACLSCHDGTIAVNSFGSKSGAFFLRAEGFLGTDMSNDHPVSFTYDAALAAEDGGLNDPTIHVVPSLGGKTVSEAMLFQGKVECSSCHDVHATRGAASGVTRLAVIRTYKSELCFACHKK